jgi:hypothetical protein
MPQNEAVDQREEAAEQGAAPRKSGPTRKQLVVHSRRPGIFAGAVEACRD